MGLQEGPSGRPSRWRGVPAGHCHHLLLPKRQQRGHRPRPTRFRLKPAPFPCTLCPLYPLPTKQPAPGWIAKLSRFFVLRIFFFGWTYFSVYLGWSDLIFQISNQTMILVFTRQGDRCVKVKHKGWGSEGSQLPGPYRRGTSTSRPSRAAPRPAPAVGDASRPERGSRPHLKWGVKCSYK